MGNVKYTIKYSDNNTPSEVIYDLMAIEKDVYKENERGHFDSIDKRFNKNKETNSLFFNVKFKVENANNLRTNHYIYF